MRTCHIVRNNMRTCHIVRNNMWTCPWMENRFQSWCGHGRIQPGAVGWFLDPTYTQNFKLNGFRPLHFGNVLFDISFYFNLLFFA